MAVLSVVILTLLAVFLTKTESESIVPTVAPIIEKKFPPSFLFGVSSAAYQIEGGWNVDGKGPSIWDTFTNNYPENIADRSNGNIATNAYELYKSDVQLMKQIGVDFYRFSISWSRILPTGDISDINEAGLQYYDSLINELLQNNIEPMITMYHFDLPQKLQDIGGWLNPLIIPYFADYADLLFTRYGHKIKYWITFNEPALYCLFGYGMAVFPPLVNMSGLGEYICGHHTLIAHAEVYRLYYLKYADKFNGKIGISLDIDFTWPKDTNKIEDHDATERFLQMKFGWFAHPIFSAIGGYPPLMEQIINKNSEIEGRRKSRLPIFSKDEISNILGSADFLGLNYYTSSYTEPANNIDEYPNPSFDRDLNVTQTYDPNWPKAKSSWLYSVPQGFKDLLIWIKEKYHNPKIIVTENGWSDDGRIKDVGRSDYIVKHLDILLNAILFDNCNIIGYTYSSLVDNFEWIQGYTEKFGLVNVNFDSPNRERILKNSVRTFAKIIDKKIIPLDYPAIDDIRGQFPRAFLFGSGTAAYQTEGAWNRDGKGPSIWDTFTQLHPELIADHSTGNIAANSYEFYRDDVKAAKKIGLNFYRFSVSWSRILPNGDVSSKNELGLQYYDNLINTLLAENIEPIITMYHFDLPQAMQDLGGWTNPIIIDYFEQYAKLLFERYADRVKIWVTFNQPLEFCWRGYGMGDMAPLITSPGIGLYMCGHHILIAHARIYQLHYNSYYSYERKIGIVLDAKQYWPKNSSKIEDVVAAKRSMEFTNGWFMHPIFSENGNYPLIMRETIDKNSKKEGFKNSRLPSFTIEEIALIKGSSDFLGINYNTARYIEPADNVRNDFLIPSFLHDRHVKESINVNWTQGSMQDVYLIPEGLKDVLNWIKTKYDNPEVIVAENGWCDDDQAKDGGRIRYIYEHLKVILDAIWNDSCYITGYTYWSLTDKFEWLYGYTAKYGLYSVDFNTLEKVRTARHSSFYYESIIKSKQLHHVNGEETFNKSEH